MKWVWRGAGVVAVALPLALLWNPRAAFYVDWTNNLWLIAYFGEYFRHHGGMPTVLNCTPAVGMAAPVFYGYLLYPSLGFLSAWVGPGWAIRIACVLAKGVELAAIVAAGRRTLRHRGLTAAVAVAMLGAAYSLTTLYNRSALPEYFATSFLASCLAFLIAAAAEHPGPDALYFGGWAAVMGAFCFGSHPGTCVLGGGLVAAILAVLLVAQVRTAARWSRSGWLGAAGFAAAAAIAVAPWFWATARWHRALAIGSGPYPLTHYPDRSDTLLARFSPIPIDWLSRQKGLSVQTPYLEAPIACALLLIVGWQLWSRRTAPAPDRSLWSLARRGILAVSLLWFAALVTISLSAPAARLAPALGPPLQFAYRLVSHCNVALLCAVFAAAIPSDKSHGAGIVVVAALALGLMALGIKLAHGAAVEMEVTQPYFSATGDRSPLVRGTGLDRPGGIGNGEPRLAMDYVTPSRNDELSAGQVGASVTFDVSPSFGDVQPAALHLDRTTWVLTNALTFPWARLWANGRRIPGDDLRRQGDYLAIRLPPGDWTLRWQWHPDPVWNILNRITDVLVPLALLGLTLWWARRASVQLAAFPGDLRRGQG